MQIKVKTINGTDALAKQIPTRVNELLVLGPKSMQEFIRHGFWRVTYGDDQYRYQAHLDQINLVYKKMTVEEIEALNADN